MYKLGPFSFCYNLTDEKKIFCLGEVVLPQRGLVLISGASGTGKSTFLNLLKGIIPEYIHGILEGRILYNNESLAGAGFQKNLNKIVYLFQNPYSQLIHQNTADEFFFSLENFQKDIGEAKILKDALSKKFELTHLWNKKTFSMSHGECQKLLLASLLALSPEVLLLDEPTAFLDPLERKRFYEILEILKKEHLVILIDHHVKEIISKIDILITVDEMGEIVLQKDIILPESAILPTYIMPQITKGSAFDIHIDNLHFSYEKYFELINIKNEVIRSGEIVIIKGKNGTGKSTLLKLISGLLVAPKNSIIIKRDGNAITPKQFYKEVAYIFQDPESSFLFDTLKEELGGESFWFTAKELERSPYLFSEGEKRRISIFSALSQNKNILLYDEPTFGQDQKNIKMLTDIILNLKKMNKLQIIISHDEDFIEKVGDRILSLKDIDSNE